MNLDDIYYDFPDLQTPLERQVNSDGFDWKAILPSFVISTRRNEPVADGFSKDKFMNRSPAFGWTKNQLDRLVALAEQSELHEFYLYDTVRHMMLRRLINTTGAATVSDLCDILREELNSGAPSPVPEWYKFSDQRYGPCVEGARRFGYKPCEMRGCTETEDMERQFLQCSQCKLACYCSKECQRADWKARHKKVCAKAKDRQEMVSKTSQVLDMLARRYDS